MVGRFNRKVIVTGTIIVAVIAASLSVVLILQQSGTPETVLTINLNDSSWNYTMVDLASSGETSEAGFVKTGTYPPVVVEPSNWTGVSVLTLLSQIENMPANYSLQILSSDGYITYFTMAEVQGEIESFDSTSGNSIGLGNFTMMLAFQQNGELLDNETGRPLRVVWIPEGDYISAGHSWPKFVREITIIDETDPWSLDLRGIDSWNMTHDVYYSLASCPHHRKYITLNDASYYGVALWTIISSMDGGSDVHYSFNNSLVSTNYTVTLWNSTGGHMNFTSYNIAFNNNIVLAGWIGDTL
ncbi:MAG: molybdopterin-dependent oxidoreductase, partial [Candidatus Thorarchaeota archaeon]